MRTIHITSRLSEEAGSILSARESSGLPRRAILELGINLGATLSKSDIKDLNTIAAIRQCAIGDLIKGYIEANIKQLTAMAAAQGDAA